MALPHKVIEMLRRIREKYPDKPADPVEDDIPPGWIRLTGKMIRKGRSRRGGWSKRQLAAIGIAWDEIREPGWVHRNTGRLIRVEEYNLFLSLRGSQ